MGRLVKSSLLKIKKRGDNMACGKKKKKKK